MTIPTEQEAARAATASLIRARWRISQLESEVEHLIAMLGAAVRAARPDDWKDEHGRDEHGW